MKHSEFNAEDLTGQIGVLRYALQQVWSPEHRFSLQLLLAQLLHESYPQEAEKEWRSLLSMQPDHLGCKFALAECYLAQGKKSHTLVILEDLVAEPDWSEKAQFMINEIMNPAIKNQAPEKTEAPIPVAVTNESDATTEEWIDAPTSKTDPRLETPQVQFSNVGGMESVKEEIRLRIIHPLTHPEIYQSYGMKSGGGILLYGPPGCGKTHLARATAGEISAMFLSVGIHEVLDMWLGQSERNLHELFETARAQKPCVLFFDEVDALGANRSDLRGSAGRQLVNQFLSEMDGLQSENEGVLVLAATNAPWQLDSAFRRPGRFDRMLFVPPPDEEARKAILEILLRNKPCENLDFKKLAAKSKGFSGADLKGVVDEAVSRKLSDAMRKGRPELISTKDLLSAIDTRKPSTREWFQSARNYALYANQGGAYDDVIQYMDKNL